MDAGRRDPGSPVLDADRSRFGWVTKANFGHCTGQVLALGLGTSISRERLYGLPSCESVRGEMHAVFFGLTLTKGRISAGGARIHHCYSPDEINKCESGHIDFPDYGVTAETRKGCASNLDMCREIVFGGTKLALLCSRTGSHSPENT